MISKKFQQKQRKSEIMLKDLKLSLNSKTHLLHHRLCKAISTFYKTNL